MAAENPEGFIPKNGGYKQLYAFQKAEIIYDGTVYFTKRFFGKYDRTIDQMVQAARSGKQNIGEGSVISATSKQLEINLTNVARASLEELKLDYEDFLRTNKLPIWDKNHRLALRVRELNRTPNANYSTFQKAIEHESPEICANTLLTLTNITIYLLKNQITTLEKEFLEQGGIRERMTRARLAKRKG